jgi:large subunit ribosomal protein L4
VSQFIEERTDRQVDVRTPAGETTGSVTLPGDLFDANANLSLMHQVVVAQLAAARQGTHATKTRAMVSGGGVKPWRQKGTGRARAGSIRAPQFTGGGVVHGPQPRDYTKKTPKKMKAAALRGALSDRAREGRVHVVSAFVDGDAPKTRAALATLNSITQAKRVLIVLDRDDVLNWVSLRNVPEVHLIEAGQLNTYDVLLSDEVIFTETALAEYVAGRTKGAVLPDLSTQEISGGVPSIAPAEGEGTVETASEAPVKKAAAKKAPAKKAAAADDAAPVKKAAAKKAPAKKATSPEEAAPATAEEAAQAPAGLGEVANAGPDAQAPTEDGTTDASTEEKA